MLGIYDANNNLITGSTHIGVINPLRYRDYYYDTESGLYYLGSRYYDPKTYRFINADTTDLLTASPMSLSDKNLFSYCDGNPVMRKDDGGFFWEELKSFGEKCLEVALVVGEVALVAAAVVGTAAFIVGTGGIGAAAVAGVAATATSVAAVTGATAVTLTAIGATAVVAGEIGSNVTYSKCNSLNQMREDVKRGRAPKEVKSVHSAHTNEGKPHVHFKDKTSLNFDGTIHDKSHGIPRITNSIAKWLGKYGVISCVK